MNFIIPENKEDLLKRASGQYYVEDYLPSRHIPIKLQEAKSTLGKSNGGNINEYFDVFFTIVSKFSDIDASIKVLAWNILKKACESFSGILVKFLAELLSEECGHVASQNKPAQLRCLKMDIYLLVEMMRCFQLQSTQNSGTLSSPPKGRKQTKSKPAVNMGLDWEKECQHGLQLLMNFVDLDIHRLWDSQIVEDEVTSLISNLCYKLMEDPAILKTKSLKVVLFHLTGCITKKSKHSSVTLYTPQRRCALIGQHRWRHYYANHDATFHGICIKKRERNVFPQLFTSTRQDEPETDGIYITKKPLSLETPNGKVAVLFMDTAGIEAGDKIECKEAELFAISTMLSFMQIVNVKNRFGWKDIDAYAALALFGQQLKVDTSKQQRLTVVVRDWENPNQCPFGKDEENTFFEVLQRRHPNARRQFDTLKKNFPISQFFFLPHPGSQVATTNTKTTAALDQTTLQYMKQLHEVLFDQEVLRTACDEAPTGRQLLEHADDFMEKLKSPHRFNPPDGSFKTYFEVTIIVFMEERLDIYKGAMEEFAIHYDLLDAGERGPWNGSKTVWENDMRYTHRQVEDGALDMLDKCFAGNLEPHKNKLKTQLAEEFEVIEGRHEIQKYIEEWCNNIQKKGNFVVSEVDKSFVDEGNNFKTKLRRRFTRRASFKRIVVEFKRVAVERYKKERERRDGNKRIAGTVAAVAVGALGTLPFLALPGFLAFAAGVEMATGVSVGLGVCGGALSGKFANDLMEALVYSDTSGEVPELENCEAEKATETGAVICPTSQEVNEEPPISGGEIPRSDRSPQPSRTGTAGRVVFSAGGVADGAAAVDAVDHEARIRDDDALLLHLLKGQSVGDVRSFFDEC